MSPRLQFVQRQTRDQLSRIGQIRHFPRGATQVGIEKSVDQAIVTGVAERRGAGQARSVGRGVLREHSTRANQIGHRQVVALILIDNKESLVLKDKPAIDGQSLT